MSQYQVLARKYRPKTFQEVLGQDAIISTLKNGLKTNRLSSAYLFSGSRGTGKTTIARLLAKALMCDKRTEDAEPCNICPSCLEIANNASLDILEIDGASHRGIDDIRVITESVGYAPSSGKYKVYIIDEVHMLTKEAFNALLKTLEEPPEKVKFLFATTEPHKVPETILSRCQRFHLRRIPATLIVDKLKRIAIESQIRVTEEALFSLAQYAEGGLRDAESMFDLLIAYSPSIQMSTIQEALGILPRTWLYAFDSAYQEQKYATVFEISQALFSQGKDIHYFLKDLIHHIRRIVHCQLGCADEQAYEDSTYLEHIRSVSTQYSSEECIAILDILASSEQAMKVAISQRIFLETILLKVMRLKALLPIDQIVMRLSKLEHALQHKQPPATPPPQKGAVTPAPTSSVEEKPLSPKREILATLQDEKPTPPIIAPPTSSSKPIPQATQSRYDTLMQFAAVELEGSLQKKQKQDK